MANHRSAEKRAKQSQKRALRNTTIKSKVKTAVRAFRDSLTDSNAETAKTALQAATRELRKAGSKGTMHTSTVSRKVSRLVAAFNKAQSA